MGKKRKKGTSLTPGAPGVSETPPPVDAALTPADTVIAPVETPAVLVETAAPPAVVVPVPAESTPATSVVEVRASLVDAVQLPDEPKPAETTEPPPVVEPTPSDAPPESEAPMSEMTASEASPSTARPKKKRKKRITKKPPAPRDILDEKIEALEAKLDAKKEQAAKAAREGFDPALDDTSVPPVDLEVHDDFFAAGERQPVTRDASGSYGGLDARHAQKLSAAAHARRAHLSRYVKWAVGGASALLLLAFTVNTLRGHKVEDPVRHEVTHSAAQPVQQPEQQNQQAAPQPSVIEIADQGNVNDPKADPTKVDDKEEAKVDEAEKKPDEMPAEKPKNAWQEKQAAKAALERGSNGAAIAAGERSVGLDPSDGEAWLVLGGAYQAMGNTGQAKRCYNACVSQGKKGPIGDCKDMLGSL
jgi:hypothetical protein